jgi:hypothetical protein
MYRFGMVPDGAFRPGLELISYLDGNLSSNGLDDPALAIQVFYLPWWTEMHMPIGDSVYLCSTTLRSALDHHRHKLTEALFPSGNPHHVLNYINELNKPAYTWHSAVNDNLPNYPNNCTRCRLYRAVGLGIMDQVRDAYNMVHGCEIASEAERDIGIRRCSGFNELHEAAIKKECVLQAALGMGSGSGPGSSWIPNQPSGKGSGKKGKEKEKESPESGRASSKWIWGVDLTKDDLLELTRGADRQGQVSHSGYDSPLPSDSLQSKSSASLDADQLEDPQKTHLWFDALSESITTVPDLPPKEFPKYTDVAEVTEDEQIDPEPDLVIEAFTKRAKTEAIRANKLVMQGEVDRPVSYYDFGSEFIPKIALIPKRPWLMPRLPIILPPTNVAFGVTPTTIAIPPPTNIVIPGSELDVDIQMPGISNSESDDIPDHIDIPDSDDHAMDVIRSDEHDIPMSDSGSDLPESPIAPRSAGASTPMTDSGSDLPQSPIAPRSVGSSGQIIGIERDPITGRFTAASFANYPDDLLG